MRGYGEIFKKEVFKPLVKKIDSSHRHRTHRVAVVAVQVGGDVDVDDVAFVRKTLSEILSSANYQVVGEAADGGEAVELFMRLRPDVITMDLVMPTMSGIDATRKGQLLLRPPTKMKK